MFLRNYWYVAAGADEVRETPLARTILNEPVVLYRTKSGTPVAFSDRCPHRGMPLSLGIVDDDRLQCRYHGLTFGPDGRCVHIPGQARIPKDAAVRQFAVFERYGLIWIWPGDASVADASEAFTFEPLARPGWDASQLHFHNAFDWRLLVENLMDFTHLTFVHGTTIGGREVAEEAEVKSTRDGDRVRTTRWMFDIPPAPTYERALGTNANVDRWQIIDFHPPSYITVNAGVAPAGTGAPEGSREGALERFSMHSITPETESSTHYFWTSAFDPAAHDAEMIKMLSEQFRQAFSEDVEILEHQQQRRLEDELLIDTVNDAGNIQVRRIMDRLAVGEKEAQMPLQASG